MADTSGVNIEISEITQIDTSDLHNQSLEDFTSVDVSLNTLEEIDSDVEMKMVGMFPKKRSLKRNTGKRQLQKHKTMLNALKKYKKTKTKEENQPIDKLGRFRYNPEKVSFQEVEDELGEIYHSYNEYFSSAMDILASYVKGQKIIYMESESHCQKQLNYLMFPSIFLSTLASVCSGAFNSAESWGGVFLASLNAGISFLLAVVSYLKLDAQSEAHKISAHQYDKLQSICEFASGSLLLFTDMTGFDKKGTPKEREKLQLIEVGANIKKRLDEIETKIKEIKETNQFIVPRTIRSISLLL